MIQFAQMKQTHKERVAALAAQVAGFYEQKKPFKIYHGSTNSTRIQVFKRSEMLDTSGLNHVLHIDPKTRTALVEPNIPMDKLVRATLKHGLIPPVVPEFPGITVGGALQGTTAESSSHIWGCFSQTLKSIEMIQGNGEVIHASPKKHSDLFYGVAGSFGTLGVTTLVEIQLIQAKKYITVEHFQVRSVRESQVLMEKFVKEGAQYIEWVMLRKNFGIIIIGTMSDTITGRLKRFSRPFDDWYYLYARDIAERGLHITDTVPLKDYLFRYNRGAFWAAELVIKHYGMPFNHTTRTLLDPFLRTRKLYQAIQSSAASQIYLCQDVMVPDTSLESFMEELDKELHLYPVGGCPIKTEPQSKLQCNYLDSVLAYNIGIYGLRVTPYEKFVRLNKTIEKTTRRHKGRKWLYAHSYYTEDEFWNIYDKNWYERLRKQYHATMLPNIYNKIVVTERYAVKMKQGALKMIVGLSKLKITP